MGLPKAVIFDMDGTITKPLLDFDRIRREIGCVKEPLLEHIALLPDAERRRAMDILERHETEAAGRAELNEGAREILDFLRTEGIRTALFTRNSRLSCDRVLARLSLQFDAVATRDDYPPKPRPDAILAICRSFAILPAEALVVGDYLYDILAGKAAGAYAILLTNGTPPSFQAPADETIDCLSELKRIVRSWDFSLDKNYFVRYHSEREPNGRRDEKDATA